MSNNQMHLHSENFDLCRLCLLEPESNRHVKFIHIFTPSNGEINMNQQLIDLLGIKVEKDDIKPKMICEKCHSLLVDFIELKKKAAESQIVINYIATKKFGGVTIPGTSNASYSTPDSKNKEVATKKKSSSLTNSRSISKNLNENNYNINGCSTSSSINSNNIQGDSSRSFITNHSKSAYVDSESDDEDPSCSVVKDPVEIVDLLSSDNEETCKSNFKNESINEAEKLYYCSICQKKNILNHDCSQHNKSFFTCLVPNCNILSRSKKDFTPHYRRHIGLSSTAVMCRRCYQEIKKTDRDASGHYHIRCRTVNLFKCYACSVVFNSMEEFAYHKLKSHNGRLMNSFGNYLCFHCEKSAPDLTTIIEHTKHCLEIQAKNIIEYGMKLKEPTENETELLPVNKSPLKNVLERKRGNVKKIPRSSTHILFTCLKPSCNLIFQNFNVFKFHHREHFELGNSLMCWQCCVPFSTLNNLRGHQVKGNCRIPGMFKCYECSEQFDDLQSLSIHKFTLHDGDLISNKKNNKNLICAYCHKGILIHNFKSHLIACQYNNVETNSTIKPKSKTTYTKKYKGPYKCIICNKVCLTAAALSSHVKIHNPSPPKKIAKKRMSNTSLKTDYLGLGNLNSPNLKAEYLEVVNTCKQEPEETNQNSTSHFDEEIESIIEMATADENNEIDAEMTTLSDHYLSNETTESVNHDTYTIKCTNCPRKFKSNSGLARHWQFCDQQNTLKSKPQRYYCTKCKKYFTRLTFFQHWRLYHGKRLPYHKYRRYSCKQCPFKFMYQIALIMHIEHEHGVKDNTVAVTSNVTPTNYVEMLPIISETTSLANNISETTSNANNIPETTSMASNIHETTSKVINIPASTSLANNILETTSMDSNIPETTSMTNNISETTSLANNIFETTSMANNIPETTSMANNIPETTSMANNIPETIMENNKEHNGHIKQKANENTLSQWPDNKIKENITEHNTNEENIEIIDITNNNDDGENETDVYTAQSINQIIDHLNDSETIDLLYDEDTMVVEHAYSMNVSESTNNYIDKTITEIDKNETSISSVVEEEKTNCLGGELVALNDTENVNRVNENKINNSVKALPSSNE
ncbi:zinc finger protein 33A [Acyrthosiphon pisum]|uniref:Uncharacterized protein n=1 Tax=Acyrthosiphon pisum TaxID=7029 RepID=A0A8R2JPV1_ACYPI|nr:zinc finger protein 33A [Acyrthosiphon pisum]XP_029343623.1 zinc finger protein 33A [Acyrthosiphon pisum]XP_029343624.1 zinc finger protein 33A [Acyrthosiphon pisum]XP_029343625.1 zinc finger protein 33A [Acyrthosiphon pisum]|eukprot:XP_001946201.2 PREDICTED: zinc finger protein 33A [Acyrthosiphon pisum]